MDGDHGDYDDIASRALEHYDIRDPRLTFLRHSDNLTYKVDSLSNDSFLLRIHIPITKAMGVHGSDPQMVKSELMWLEALNRDTDLLLQKPIRNKQGNLVTHISNEETPFSCNCTLLHWIEGQDYNRDLETEDTAYQIGEILAKLHNHSEWWQIPEGFKRPNRDIDYFKRVLAGLLPAVEDGRIRSTDFFEFKTSIDLLLEIIRLMGDCRKNRGIIHADPHKGNMLLYEGAIRLIDFSFCAFGHFMFDIGICLSDMKENLHQSFLRGYKSLRILPDDYKEWIEGFFIGSMVGTLSYWVPNPQTQNRLREKAPNIAQKFSKKFNQGERFWFIK
jgi:Ser/Thr protein kinase RdoA (MazF antagonist)